MIFGDIIRKVLKKLFPRHELEKKLSVELATSSEMENAIDLWLDMYKNHPPWQKKDVKSLNLPAAIAEEMSRLVLTEFSFTVSGSERADFINDKLSNMLSNISNIVELWSVYGGFCIKPVATGINEAGNPDNIMVDVVYRCYPTAVDSNKHITGMVFLDSKRIGDYLYTRLEYHSLEGEHYTVVNKAYRSERLSWGNNDEDRRITCEHPMREEVPLDIVPEWEGIKEKVDMDGMKRPQFVYIKQPRANNIEPDSPLGVSVFSRAVPALEEIDKQWSLLLREFRATKAKIYADPSLFGKDITGKPILPDEDDGLYRISSEEHNEEKPFYEVYSPEIREESLINGMNDLYRKIEFQCGLAYGTLSDISDVEKTAQEIKIAKQRSYTAIGQMQRVLEDGLREAIAIVNDLCSLYKIVPEGKTDVSCTWGDGVREDTDIEFQRRFSMVSAGMLSAEKFMSWYFGVPEDAVHEMMPEETPEFDVAEE